jgi:hypothetical protein
MLNGGGTDASSRSAAILLSTILFIAVWLGWSVTNWLLSVAPIFVAINHCGTFAAIRSTAEFFVKRLGGFIAIGLWFGIARLTIMSVVGWVCLIFIAIVPTSSAAVPPAIATSCLGYFVLADFLYMGRLAAYLSLAESPMASRPQSFDTPNLKSPTQGDPRVAVDPSELILSDRPDFPA